jgi:hypothetical protein
MNKGVGQPTLQQAFNHAIHVPLLSHHIHQAEFHWMYDPPRQLLHAVEGSTVLKPLEMYSQNVGQLAYSQPTWQNEHQYHH